MSSVYSRLNFNRNLTFNDYPSYTPSIPETMAISDLLFLNKYLSHEEDLLRIEDFKSESVKKDEIFLECSDLKITPGKRLIQEIGMDSELAKKTSIIITEYIKKKIKKSTKNWSSDVEVAFINFVTAAIILNLKKEMFVNHSSPIKDTVNYILSILNKDSAETVICTSPQKVTDANH